jgi:hypothetical protein
MIIQRYTYSLFEKCLNCNGYFRDCESIMPGSFVNGIRLTSPLSRKNGMILAVIVDVSVYVLWE